MSGRIIPAIWGEGGDFQELGNRPLVGLLTVPWNCCGASSSWAPFVAQLVKNPPVVRETWVRALVWEDPLEKGKAAHSSILAWRIPRTVQSMGSQRVVFSSSSNVSRSVMSHTLCDPKDCSPPSFSVHGILQARMKNTGAGCHFLLGGSSRPRDQTQVSSTAGRFFTI